MISQLRLNNELKIMNNADYSDIFTAKIINDNILTWEIILNGPQSSLYDGYMFKLLMEIPNNYPNTPPKVKFITPIKHLNVNLDGDICLNILKNDEWMPSLTIPSIIISIVSLLSDPNPDDPLNSELCQKYRSSPETYKKEILEYCHTYAMQILNNYE